MFHFEDAWEAEPLVFLSAFLNLRKCKAHSHGNQQEYLLSLPTLGLQQPLKMPPLQAYEHEIDKMSVSNKELTFILDPIIHCGGALCCSSRQDEHCGSRGRASLTAVLIRSPTEPDFSKTGWAMAAETIIF